jgi:MoxR-like ATPase
MERSCPVLRPPRRLCEGTLTVRHHLDRRDGLVYVPPQKDMDLALRITEITGRPLLLSGDPGTGKSSVAAWVAAQRNWRYYEHTVTARTEAADLLWTFDTVRKLADASNPRGGDLDDHDYVEPGPLWWAFARDEAFRRGRPVGMPGAAPAAEPGADLNAKRSPSGAVVLIDEIDKADPDVPNALLVPLGSGIFTVSETGTEVKVAPEVEILIVVTTNGERDLPSAFERRCVLLELEHADRRRLLEIAESHAQAGGIELSGRDMKVVGRIADRIEDLRQAAADRNARPPGIAEFLDAVWACLAEDIDPGNRQDDRWAFVESMTLRKDRRLR